MTNTRRARSARIIFRMPGLAYHIANSSRCTRADARHRMGLGRESDEIFLEIDVKHPSSALTSPPNRVT